MKILQVMAGAAHGGAETAFVDMCLALHKAGQEVEVATRRNDRNSRLKDAGIPVHTMRFGGFMDFITPLRLKHVIRCFRPAVVQTWMSRASWKTPSSSDTASEYRYITCARLGGYYKMKYFENTDYFVAITPDIKRYIESQGVPADKVRHINNFAETETVATPVSRDDLDTPQTATVLLALARLHEAKAFDTLLKALSRTPDHIYLWIAGEGPQRESLERLCASLGLNDRVRFLGWRDDRAALFEAADICVFPSRYEPFGTVFVQAWAHKIPLITSTADGPRQYVRHEDDGLIFPVDDIDALSEAISRADQDQRLCQSMVEAGFTRYNNEFTKEKTVEAYLEFYRYALAREKIQEGI